LKPSDPHVFLDEILRTRTIEEVMSTLERAFRTDIAGERSLTIIANAGVHTIPNAYIVGEVYEASRGDWDVSTEEALLSELKNILSHLVHKLRSEPWTHVYLIPTGHPVLSLQIKAMVYRILRINTIDLYYKGGTYLRVNLDQRAIALGANDGE